jgi:hypothetical protein
MSNEFGWHFWSLAPCKQIGETMCTERQMPSNAEILMRELRKAILRVYAHFGALWKMAT